MLLLTVFETKGAAQAIYIATDNYQGVHINMIGMQKFD